jgi:hypothetical protein
LDEDEKKKYSNLQHASVARPFAPTMFASSPTEPTLQDRDLALKAQGQNPEAGRPVPGATPVFPKEDMPPTSALEDRGPTSFTIADNLMATQNDIHVPHAFSVGDAPYAEVYATNDIENGDSPTKSEPSKRCSPAMRYGIIACVVCVIALVVTLVVVFAAKPPPAAKSQFVQYSAVWSASLPLNFSPSTVISDLELKCLGGGILKSPVITSVLPERLDCPAEGKSTIRCTQTPYQQTADPVVVDASISFQCHGTSPDQLVGQASVFDTTISYFGGTFGIEYFASQLIVLQTMTSAGSYDLEGKCSGELVILENPADPTGSTNLVLCGSVASCVSDGTNACDFELEGRSEVQRAPVNDKHIQDV